MASMVQDSTTPTATARAQRRIELKVKRGKGTLSPQRQEYARYVIVFTTLPDHAANVDEVLEGTSTPEQIVNIARNSVALAGKRPITPKERIQ